MYLVVGREIYPVGGWGLEVLVFYDLEGAFGFVLELPGWSSGARVLGEESYQIPKTEVWHHCVLLIGLVLITLLSVNHAGPCEHVDFGHLRG